MKALPPLLLLETLGNTGMAAFWEQNFLVKIIIGMSSLRHDGA